MKIQIKKYLITVGGVLLVGLLFGRGTVDGVPSNAKVMDELTMPTQSVININNMAYWMKKSSAGTTSGSPNGTQADYPIGTGGLIYEDGMLWGVKVTDGNSQSPRVGGTTYYAGLKAGRVIYDGDGNVVGATDPALHHVWRVRTDYKTVDLSADAGNFLMESDPSEAQVQSVYDQYDYDWNNWPAAWGAPYNDVDGDGVYTPGVWDADNLEWIGDIPGYTDASQTLWVVANDVPQVVNEDGTAVLDDDGNPVIQNTAPNVYGADPVGIELQVTMWAYKFAADNPLGNIVFKRARMKYTGLVAGYNDFDPAIANLDTVYFTQWSDPDLGTYTDDYVGCDVELSFGYVYNGNTLDGVFNGIYQLPVPAGGYDFLQGPEVDGEYMPMTSFTYFGAGSSISDPDLSDYNGTLQFFNLMEGYLPRPEYPVQTPWTDLATGQVTKFVLSGDPVSGSGWVDGVQLPPGDRRLVMASGPFQMNLGEQQDVVLALIGGLGADAVSSVTVAKFHDQSAQYAYDNAFDLPSPPTTPDVTTFEMDQEISLDWGSTLSTVSSTELTVTKGFEFEGYNVYQIPSPTSPLSEGVRLVTFDKINLIKAVFDMGVDPTSGYVLPQVKQYGTDSGIQRFYQTDYDELRKRPMSNGITYHFAVTAYSFNPTAVMDLDPFVTLESTPAIVSVTPHSENPGADLLSQTSGDISTTHEGTAGGNVSVTITNPDELTGDDYEVNFDLQHYYMDVDGSWKFTDYADSVGTAGKILDVSPSSVTGIAYTSPTAGTRDIKFIADIVSPDYNYAAGVKLTFPAGITINSVEAPGGIAAMISTDGSNSVMFGDMDVDGAGDFAGGEMITVNISTPTLPLDVEYVIYDDGWATLWCVDNAETCEAYQIGPGYTETVNAEGTCTISEEAYAFKTIKHWNLVNTSTGDVLLEDMFTMNGVDLENIVGGVYDAGGAIHGAQAMQTTEGFYVNVSVGYDAPVNYESISDGGVWYGSESYTIGSYYDYGWASSAKSIHAYGAGFTEVDYLQRDVKVVWDGVYGEPDANGYVPVVEGGSQAWLYGARGYDIATHLDPNNPGTGDPFLVTVPFKVYDMEPVGGGDPVQIGIIIYDRVADPAVTPFYAFNPAGRMYTEFVLRPYDETLADFASNEAFLTWNTVWWGAPYTAGDEILFVYANPIQQGVDKWTFSSVANADGGAISQDEIDQINVYPNPYYGFHELEASRSDKYVSFNHLPEKATIRVFTMGGTMVREINKNDATQFATWDLANQYGYPVASGLYIIHIDTPYGEKILKLALVQETQVLKYY